MKLYSKYRNYILVTLIVFSMVGNYFVAQNTWLGRQTSTFSTPSSLFDDVSDGDLGLTLPVIPRDVSTDILNSPLFVSLNPLEPYTIPKSNRIVLTDESSFQFEQVKIVYARDNSHISVVWSLPSEVIFSRVAIYRSEQAGVAGARVGEVAIRDRIWRDELVGDSPNLFYTLRPLRDDGTEFDAFFQYPIHVLDSVPPPPPTSVNTSLVTNTQVTLSWQNPDIGDRAFSRVYRGTIPGNGIALIGDRVSGETYTDLTVTPGEQYMYIVTSVDISGNESDKHIPSELNKSLGAALHEEQHPIKNISVEEAFNDGTIFISWENPDSDGFSHVRIYRSATFLELGDDIADAQPGATSYIDSSAAVDTDYYYTLKAVDTSGDESGLLRQLPGRARDTIPPSTPESVIVSVEGNTDPLISWNSAAGDVSYYRVYRSHVLGDPGYLIADGVVTTALRDTSVRTNTPYFYSVSAVDRAGNESTLGGAENRFVPFAPATEPSFPITQ